MIEKKEKEKFVLYGKRKMEAASKTNKKNSNLNLDIAKKTIKTKKIHIK